MLPHRTKQYSSELFHLQPFYLPCLSLHSLQTSLCQSAKCHIIVLCVITEGFVCAGSGCCCVCVCVKGQLTCVFLPLMVTSFGCGSIREAPLRTRGTRGLPESGMPHRRSLIHQIRGSHCRNTSARMTSATIDLRYPDHACD